MHGSTASPEDVKRDIEATLGRVPTWMEEGVPKERLEAAWSDFKEFEMSDRTAIPPKYKELIGLAVASQVPCQYCVHFHTEAAKLHGANEQEIREAVYQAGVTRHFSTILNGLAQDFDDFRRETDAIVAHVKRSAGKQTPPPRR